MRNARFVAAAVLTAAMAACSSPKDASEGNFEKVINDRYARQCILVRPDGGFRVDARQFPVTVGLLTGTGSEKRNDERNVQFVALVEVGLLEVEDTTTELRQMFGNAKQVPAKRYSLTTSGEKAYQSGKDEDGEARPSGFCAGHYLVDEIKRFSEPGSFGAYTVSEVAYSFSPQNVAEWATEPKVQEAIPRLSMALKPAQDGKAALVLTNEGWVHQADFDE